MTEPDPVSFVPTVSQQKLGQLLSVTIEDSDVFLEIQLREDFVQSDDEEMLLEAVAAYKGKGLYRVLLSDIVHLMVMVSNNPENAKLKESLGAKPAQQ